MGHTLASIENAILEHSWPLWEQPRHFDLGLRVEQRRHRHASTRHGGGPELAPCRMLGVRSLGQFADLVGRRLTTSSVCRGTSRSAGRKRSLCTARNPGPRWSAFAHIRSNTGAGSRSMSKSARQWEKSAGCAVIGAPTCIGDRAVQLRGLKLII